MAAATGAGCAGPTAAHRDPGGDPGSADRVPVLLRSAGLRLPLEDFFPSVTENQRLARAGRALLRQCMREFGIDYAAPDPPSVLGPLTWTERRYGLTDPAQAGHGYWADTRAVVARAAAAGRPRDTATAAANDLATGEGAAVVNGRPVPPGGCAAEARRRLTAHDPAGADPTLAQRLLSDSFFGSQQDPRVHAALTQWSACMAAAGYRYAGPLDPPEDARFQQGLTPLEVATAAADIGCKQRTNLVGIWFTVEASRQWSQVGANSAALRLARAAFQAELAVAAAVGV